MRILATDGDGFGDESGVPGKIRVSNLLFGEDEYS
jgi:hypothetical protein